MKSEINERYLKLKEGKTYDEIILDIDYLELNYPEERYIVDILNLTVDKNLNFLIKLGIVKNVGYGYFGDMYGIIKVKKEYSEKLFEEIDSIYREAYKTAYCYFKLLEG